MTVLTQRRLKQLVGYDPETGLFVRLQSKFRNSIGSVAGWRDSRGYRRLRVAGGIYKAHRLAWFYVYGQWPSRAVDHVNGDCSDNRIANLRLATAAQNACNRGPNKSNTTGLKGVHFHRGRQEWRAKIRYGGKDHFLGRFPSKEEAAVAYREAAIRHHGEFARLSPAARRK